MRRPQSNGAFGAVRHVAARFHEASARAGGCRTPPPRKDRQSRNLHTERTTDARRHRLVSQVRSFLERAPRCSRAISLSTRGVEAMAEVKEKPSLTIVRRFNVAPEKVWHACTSAQALKQWMAPSDAFSNVLAEADVRVGGRFHIIMKAPDGELHDVSGVYRDVVPNRKLVYTWAWKSTPERESLVTLRLRPDGDGTEL